MVDTKTIIRLHFGEQLCRSYMWKVWTPVEMQSRVCSFASHIPKFSGKLPSIPHGSAALSNMSYTNLYSTLDQSVTNWHNSTLFHSNLYNLLWVLIQGFLVFNFVLIDHYHNFGFCFVTCNQMHTGQGEIKCYSSNHPCHVCNLQVHQQK